MPSLLQGMQVKVGSRLSRMQAYPAALDDPNPIVQWTLPAGFRQARYSVKIECVETGETAFTTSGARQGTDDHFQVPLGVQLTNAFNGLCKASVAVSEVEEGEFEWLGPDVYFVYDVNLERFTDADEVKFYWTDAINPDFLPPSGEKVYEVQVATNPLFPSGSIVYDGQQDDDTSPIVFHLAPSGEFDPLDDIRPYLADRNRYFYRIRYFDGLDWGDWSKVGAFENFDHQPTEFEFLNVEYTGNRHGDVNITFRVSYAEPLRRFHKCSVEIMFVGTGNDGFPKPVSLVNSNLLLPPGTHTVTWRAPRNVGRGPANVMLTGRAWDHYRSSNEDYRIAEFDTTHVDPNVPNDDPHTFTSDTNFGSVFVKYNVEGQIGSLPEPNVDYALLGPPVNGQIADLQYNQDTNVNNVDGGPFAWWNIYAIGRVERNGNVGFGSADGGSTSGPPYPFGPGRRGLYWPKPMAQTNVASGETWSYTGVDTAVERKIVTTNAAFLFKTPVDNDRSDTLPIPDPSRVMHLKGYLKGYLDLSGEVVEYPNEYDWNTRPEWHIGREVWAQGDAWVQVAVLGYSDYEACEACKGRSWEAYPVGAKYSRRKCSNPNCVDGFDHTKPRIQEYEDFSRILMKKFIDIKWYRFSSFMSNPTYVDNDRFDLNIEGSIADPSHDHSQLPEPVEGNLKEPIGAEPPVNTTIPVGGIEGNIVTGTTTQEMVAPVIGRLEDPWADFSTTPGTTTDTVAPSGRRPGEPIDWDQDVVFSVPSSVDVGDYMIEGRLWRSFDFREMDFRFLPAWWDAYITVHFAHNGSETSKVQVQYASVFDNNTLGAWRDVAGVSSTYEPACNGYATKPLTFHQYWDTHLQAEFVEGGKYVLRMRMVDPPSRSISEWILSRPFTILHGVTNPANITSTTYDPWTHEVKIDFRVDDTQSDLYDIIRFWYSKDDGYTWSQIGRGDIIGQITNLLTATGNDTLTHTIYWRTENYNIGPGDNYRVKMETIPSGYLDNSMLPFFRWISTINPGIDEADSTLSELLGRLEKYRWDQTTGTWKVLTTPIKNPGQIFFWEQELERIRSFPNSIGPNGIYTFISPYGDGWPPVPDGSIADPSGYILPAASGQYNQWLQQTYVGSETIGQAMRRVAESIRNALDRQVPKAQKTVADGERRIRRDLMDQGYFAEQNFVSWSASGAKESIRALAVSSDVGLDVENVTQEREWKWRVQNAATGGENIADDEGRYHPKYVTELEDVYYRVQLDKRLTFDSQEGEPLRDILYNWDGVRLSATRAFAGNAIVDSDTSLADSQPDANSPLSGNPSNNNGFNQFNNFSDSTDYPIEQFSGDLKILPADLPGQHNGDTFVDDQDKWSGGYQWRFRAYNKITSNNVHPAHLKIDSLEFIPGISLVNVDFTMSGHPKLISGRITGVSVSRQTVTPHWTSGQVMDWISDRRANASQAVGSTTLPHTPTGRNRSYPSVIPNPITDQINLYITKLGYDGAKYKLVDTRSNTLGSPCEYNVLFDNTTHLAIMRPSVVKAGDTYFMYVSYITSGGTNRVGVSTSTDLKTWTSLTQVSLPSSSTMPSVIYEDGTFKMWVQGNDFGKTCVFYATSSDGYNFTLQNGGANVYEDDTSITVPSVIKINGGYVMYYNVVGSIASVVSSDGITWSSKQIETMPSVDGLPNGTYTFCNPYAFLYNYKGNDELFLAYNARDGSGNNTVCLCRLEDRVWVDGSLSDLTTSAAYQSSPGGIPHRVTLRGLRFGLSLTDPIKLRFETGNVLPAKIEYLRQSDWVDSSNVGETDSLMDPTEWLYNELILGIPYFDI